MRRYLAQTPQGRKAARVSELFRVRGEPFTVAPVGPLRQIHVSVTDIDRSVAFYRDVLGMKLLFQVQGRPMAFFQSGDVRLYLGVVEAAEFRSHTVHYYEVDDIDAERARLESRGVTFFDQPHVVHRDADGELWMTGFRDPDGHFLMLMQQR